MRLMLCVIALLAFPAIARADDGALDASFGPITQSLHTNLGTPAGAGFHRLVVQPDGKLVAAGFARFGTDSRIVMARYSATGLPDTSFAGGLFMTDVPGYTRDVAEDVMVLPDGRVEVAGTAFAADRSDIMLVRYTPAGALDQLLGGVGYRVDRDYQDQGGGLVHDVRGLAAVLLPGPAVAVAGSAQDMSTTPNEALSVYRFDGVSMG